MQQADMAALNTYAALLAFSVIDFTGGQQPYPFVEQRRGFLEGIS
jgi:hypothetical protein